MFLFFLFLSSRPEALGYGFPTEIQDFADKVDNQGSNSESSWLACQQITKVKGQPLDRCLVLEPAAVSMRSKRGAES